MRSHVFVCAAQNKKKVHCRPFDLGWVHYIRYLMEVTFLIACGRMHNDKYIYTMNVRAKYDIPIRAIAIYCGVRLFIV